MNPKASEHRFRRLKEMGCDPCFTIGVMDVPPEIHHQNLGGKAGQKRLGDECTVPLCPWHHQGRSMYGLTSARMRSLYGPSLKLHSRAFRLQFGRDEVMLARVNDRMLQMDQLAYGHRSTETVDTLTAPQMAAWLRETARITRARGQASPTPAEMRVAPHVAFRLEQAAELVEGLEQCHREGWLYAKQVEDEYKKRMGHGFGTAHGEPK